MGTERFCKYRCNYLFTDQGINTDTEGKVVVDAISSVEKMEELTQE